MQARDALLARLPYIRFQHSIEAVPDLDQFWTTTWNSDSPYRYQIAEAFVDYLIRKNPKMLKRCHDKCARQVPPHRYFTSSEIETLNRAFQKHINEVMKRATR